MKTFTVTMGQAFYESLPRELSNLGGRVGRTDRGAVEVTVRVSFAKGMTARRLQDALWGVWPSCSIAVSPAHGRNRLRRRIA